MKYKASDLREAIIGSFVSVLFFLAIRAGETFKSIDLKIGLLITLAWFFVVFKSFKSAPDGEHFFINIFVVYAICAALSIAFGTVTLDLIKINPFGNIAMVATWMALPVALLFDKNNIGSVLSRYYVRGVKK